MASPPLWFPRVPARRASNLAQIYAQFAKDIHEGTHVVPRLRACRVVPPAPRCDRDRIANWSHTEGGMRETALDSLISGQAASSQFRRGSKISDGRLP